ncbi:MAG: ectonucleotide pyrophosphatase/phosphodiesterase [Acidobacteriota bacterium]
MRNKVAQFLILYMIAALILAVIQPSLKAQQQKPAPPPAKPKPPKFTSHVILISISGLRADDLNNAETLRLNIPTILALRAKGSYAVSVESVYPSQSSPAHVSMVTGALPADHGITSDFPFDEMTGTQSAKPHLLSTEIKTDTLWEAARREGLITAAIGYPLTAGASINFNLPEAPEERSNSNPPELRSEVLAALKTEPETSPATSKSYDLVHQTHDDFKAGAAAYVIEKYRPNLLLINFTSLDLAQRRFGLRAIETRDAVGLIDGLVKKIVSATDTAKLTDETTFLIVSDHGSSQVEREFRPNVLLAKKGLLTIDEQGNVKSWNAVVQSFEGSAAVLLKNPQDETMAREVEKLFSELDKDSDNPLWRITSRRDAARLGADPRVSLYLDAAPRYKISPRGNGSTVAKTDDRAAYGYLPSRAEMRATLILAGKGIKAGQRIEYARLIDIAPTVVRLLGLEMKSARGRSLSEVITQ